MEGSRLIDQYSLLERVAEGSYGEVYKALHKQSKEIVAVKRFKGASRVGLPTSFVREHYILNALTGKFIPKVLDVYPNEEPPVIVMEWCSLTLEQVLKNKKKYAIKQFFLQILEALDNLHSNGFLHRDIKPANIMLSCKSCGSAPDVEALETSPAFYDLKLIDFGMAKEQAWQTKDMTNQVGSLYYRAPELLNGEKRYSNKIDMWSLGCVFYFMQTGTTLFRGHSEIDQFRKIVTILGADSSKIKNPKIKDALVKLNMENVPQNWTLIEKPINQIEFDFLKKMVVLEPERRHSFKELLMHPYLRDDLLLS